MPRRRSVRKGELGTGERGGSRGEVARDSASSSPRTVDAVKESIGRLATHDKKLLNEIEAAPAARDAKIERARAERDATIQRARAGVAELDTAIARAMSECAVVIDRAWAACRVLRTSATAQCRPGECRHCDVAIERANEERDGAIAKARALYPADSEAAIDEASSQCEAKIERARAQHDALVERLTAERHAVRTEMVSAESELAMLLKPVVDVSGDSTALLSDQLMGMILEWLPGEVLWSGACERVCQRWARLMESAALKLRKRERRWAAYESGTIQPTSLEGHTADVTALAVGLDGKVYSGSKDYTIRVWSGDNGAHLHTLEGHTKRVVALTIGLSGKLYSGSWDCTIRVWSSTDDAHLQTLEGHTNRVTALAVGLGGKVYLGAFDKTIRVWSGDDGTHILTLEGHESGVSALAVGLDGKVYSGSNDSTVRVWSDADMGGECLAKLDAGQMGSIRALAVGLDGRLYSGGGASPVCTVLVWSSATEEAHTQTLEGHTSSVSSLAVGHDGKVYSGSESEICVWSGKDGTLLHRLNSPATGMSLSHNGSLFTCFSNLLGDGSRAIKVW
jgi:WD40 repeat protein